jgi:hypothetical protein
MFVSACAPYGSAPVSDRSALVPILIIPETTSKTNLKLNSLACQSTKGPSHHSFAPKSEWKACLISAVHEPVIRFAKNAPIGASKAFELYRGGNSPRRPCDLQLDLANRFLRADVRTETDVLDHKWAGELGPSV